MFVKTIYQFIGLCISYGILIYGTTAFAFWTFIKNKNFSQRFIFETIVGNFYIINIVFLLELLKISNPYTLRIVIFGGAVLIRYFTDKENMQYTYSCFLETVKRIAKKEYSIKLFLKLNITKFLKTLKEYSVFVFAGKKIEWLLLLIPTVFNFYHYSYFAFNYYTLAAPDCDTHMMWAQNLKYNIPFCTGVYPYGFHNIVYALSDVFNIRIITVMRLLSIIATMIIMTMIYLLLKQICHSRYAPIIAYTVCCIYQMYIAEATFRYQATLPQEYAMISLYPMAIYLFAYLRNKKNEDLVLFGMSFALTIMVHFYVTIIAGLICLAIGITYLFRIIKRKYLVKLITCGLLSLFVAIFPLGIGYMQGYGLEPSLNWALNVINDSTASSNQSSTNKITNSNSAENSESVEPSESIDNTEDIEDSKIDAEIFGFIENHENIENISNHENLTAKNNEILEKNKSNLEEKDTSTTNREIKTLSLTNGLLRTSNYELKYSSIANLDTLISTVRRNIINNSFVKSIANFCQSKWGYVSKNIFVEGKSGFFWIVFILIFVTILHSLVRIIFRHYCEENMMQCSMAVFMLLLFVLISCKEFGLPSLMDFHRARIFFVYAVPLMVVMPLEIIYELLVRNLNKKKTIVRGSILRLEKTVGLEKNSDAKSASTLATENISDKKINLRNLWIHMVNGIMVIATIVIVSLIIYTGNLKQFTFVYYLQRPEAMEVLYNIMDNYPAKKWTIISPVDETYMGINDGWHEELVDFIKKMENWNPNMQVQLPTTYVFLFIEKQPISYSSEFYLNNAPYETPELTYEDADKRLVEETGLSSDYYKNQRRLLMARAYYWAKEYQKYFPKEMHVYFENDYFIVYKIEQSDYYLNNFAIDYGFNTKRYLQ